MIRDGTLELIAIACVLATVGCLWTRRQLRVASAENDRIQADAPIAPLDVIFRSRRRGTTSSRRSFLAAGTVFSIELLLWIGLDPSARSEAGNIIVGREFSVAIAAAALMWIPAGLGVNLAIATIRRAGRPESDLGARHGLATLRSIGPTGSNEHRDRAWRRILTTLATLAALALATFVLCHSIQVAIALLGGSSSEAHRITVEMKRALTLDARPLLLNLPTLWTSCIVVIPVAVQGLAAGTHRPSSGDDPAGGMPGSRRRGWLRRLLRSSLLALVVLAAVPVVTCGSVG